MSIDVAVPMTESLVRPRRRGLGASTEQIVITQVAVVLLLTGFAIGGIAMVPAVAASAALLALTWLRLRGRWAFQWLGVLIRFAGRRRSAPIDGTTALLGYAAPRVRPTTLDLPGEQAAALADDAGLTVMIELGDPADEASPVPSFATVLQATGRDGAAGKDQPGVRVQLVLSAVSAPTAGSGTGPPQSSYRTLAEGSSLGHLRAVLALRVSRAGGWSEEELHRSLAGITRRVTRRLGAARPLGEVAALRAIADLANTDASGGPGPAQESWAGLRLGGLLQATFHCRPAAGRDLPGALITRILHLPAAATTVALTATALFVRLAAPDAPSLEAASRALRTLLAAERIRIRRWDGAHLPGLAATLPLGGPAPDGPAFGVPEVPISPAGLMVGRNRHGGPVLVRLFRPEPTRALLVGGLGGAQMLAFRAMATGARVQVRTTRPHDWEPFARGAAVPGESITILPPGSPFEAPAGSVRHPVLTILDTGATTAGREPSREGGWQTTLVFRDEFGTADVPHATEADVVVLQPLLPAEATLLGGALGLGDTTPYLTRMRADMIAVVNRRAVRWATLSQTPIEQSLIGPPARNQPVG
ncbi:type VII secretion protein EccE [Actinoplanes hulinensis]|uniref:Type VII secretion protein EccE n=1 Tax=Actinoplanes hulinensis TaxID=1144547 RepID=A0ABS7B9I1_9ACTN|nr:type VII secretion protein EccE [Actinoplanes hulinensis]MBW6437716.1 type VII secretion protein EccE [Actinoplanes hulinensis]